MKPQQIRKEREDVECDRIRSVGKSGRLAYVGVTVVERGAVLVGLGLVEGCLNAGHLGPIEGTYGRKRYLTTRQAGKQANRQAGKQAKKQAGSSEQVGACSPSNCNSFCHTRLYYKPASE